MRVVEKIYMKGATFAMIKPRAVRDHLGDILKDIVNNGLTIRRMETRKLSEEEAAFLYAEHRDKSAIYPPLVEYTLSGPVVLLELVYGNNPASTVQFWRMVIGSYDIALHRSQDGTPHSPTLRALYGNPEVIRENAVHGSSDEEAARRELGKFFPADSK